MNIDLHSHSTASDGTLSPSQLVSYAKEKKIEVLALTDHDTTNGLAEAQEEAEKQGIVFVPGIEVSVEWPTGEFHLLGLGLTHESFELSSIIKFIAEERERRNRTMAEKLRESGLDLSYEEVLEKSHTNTLGRPHFADVMIEKGFVKNRQQAFDRYFAKGRPCYVDRRGADLGAAVKAIKASGGIPVMAHPLSIYVAWGKMEDTLTQIRDKGVMGFEAWHPGARISEAERLEALAKKLKVIATGGSDFHGQKVRADRHIGFASGGLKIPDRLWKENLLPLLGKNFKADFK